MGKRLPLVKSKLDKHVSDTKVNKTLAEISFQDIAIIKKSLFLFILIGGYPQERIVIY